MAGESARESARRQREKAERLQRSAQLWERGADGESATADVLAQLPRETWTVLHDLRWPGRRYANVDHVVIGPPGIFVIDSKNWSGSVTVRDGVLRQNGRSRLIAVTGAADAAMVVATLTPTVPPGAVKPVLCFVGDSDLSGWSRDVMISSTGNIVSMLLSRPVVLHPEQVRFAALELDAQLQSATVPMTPRAPVRRTAMAPRKATPVAPQATRARSRRTKRRSGHSGVGVLLRLGVGLALVGVLLGSPQIFTGLSQQFAELFVNDLLEDTGPVDEPARESAKKDADTKEKVNRNQR